jgi:hypothetical protein
LIYPQINSPEHRMSNTMIVTRRLQTVETTWRNAR